MVLNNLFQRIISGHEHLEERALDDEASYASTAEAEDLRRNSKSKKDKLSRDAILNSALATNASAFNDDLAEARNNLSIQKQKTNAAITIGAEVLAKNKAVTDAIDFLKKKWASKNSTIFSELDDEINKRISDISSPIHPSLPNTTPLSISFIDIKSDTNKSHEYTPEDIIEAEDKIVETLEKTKQKRKYTAK